MLDIVRYSGDELVTLEWRTLGKFRPWAKQITIFQLIHDFCYLLLWSFSGAYFLTCLLGEWSSSKASFFSSHTLFYFHCHFIIVCQVLPLNVLTQALWMASQLPGIMLYLLFFIVITLNCGHPCNEFSFFFFPDP